MRGLSFDAGGHYFFMRALLLITFLTSLSLQIFGQLIMADESSVLF